MNKQKKTVDLDRFATEARADSREIGHSTPTPLSERLQKLLSNVGKTVILPINFLTIQDNIRQILDMTAPEFKQLVESIRKNGVKQNLIGDLRVGENSEWKIICVAG